MDRLLDVNDLAELLRVKPSTIYSWIHTGYIPHHKVGRLVRFREKEIEDWFQGTRIKGRKQRIPDIGLDSK